MTNERPQNKVYSVKLPAAYIDDLRAIYKQTGATVAEQIRRAVAAWITKQRTK